MSSSISLDVLLAFAKDNLSVIESISGQANDVNLVEELPWRLREQLRTVEGLLDRAETELVELVGRLGTDKAEAFLDSMS